MKTYAEIKNEGEGEFMIPVCCRNCGELFNLNQDFKESEYDIEEVLKEKCGSSELLCWKCRDCD